MRGILFAIAIALSLFFAWGALVCLFQACYYVAGAFAALAALHGGYAWACGRTYKVKQ